MSAPGLTGRSGVVEVRIPVRSPQIAPLQLSGFQCSAVQCSDLLPGRANDDAGRHFLHPPSSSRLGKKRNIQFSFRDIFFKNITLVTFRILILDDQENRTEKSVLAEGPALTCSDSFNYDSHNCQLTLENHNLFPTTTGW